MNRNCDEAKLQGELEEYEDASNELMLLDDDTVRVLLCVMLCLACCHTWLLFRFGM